MFYMRKGEKNNWFRRQFYWRCLVFFSILVFSILGFSLFWKEKSTSTLAAGVVARTSSDSDASAFSNQRGKIPKASDDTLIIIYQAGGESPNGLAFSRSTDNGQTWSSGTQLDGSWDAFASAVILSMYAWRARKSLPRRSQKGWTMRCG